jgi:hypothetical protein
MVYANDLNAIKKAIIKKGLIVGDKIVPLLANAYN